MADSLQQRFASKAQVVYMVLYDRIRKGILRPGERLLEQELANELGVSKTPVREALHKLSEQGLVTLEPYKGAYVAQFSVEDLLEIMEIRAVLEGLAARLAAKTITEEALEELNALIERFEAVSKKGTPQDWIEANAQFHSAIAAACGNKILKELLSGFQRKILLSSTLGIGEDSQKSIKEHKDIVEALWARDPDRAEFFARRHVWNTAKRVAVLKTRTDVTDEVPNQRVSSPKEGGLD